MKKLMACMLVFVIVLSMSVTAFASSFTPSVEVKDPALEDSDNDKGKIIITLEDKKDKASKPIKDRMDAAEEAIEKSPYEAKELFDVALIDVDGPVTVTIKNVEIGADEKLALIDKDGNIKILTEGVDYTITKAGHIKLTLDKSYTFAVLKDNLLATNGKVSPETGVEMPVGMMVATVALMGTAVVLTSKAKR